VIPEKREVIEHGAIGRESGGGERRGLGDRRGDGATVREGRGEGGVRGLAADHAADGIRVNAVGPGPIYTPVREESTRESVCTQS